MLIKVKFLDGSEELLEKIKRVINNKEKDSETIMDGL